MAFGGQKGFGAVAETAAVIGISFVVGWGCGTFGGDTGGDDSPAAFSEFDDDCAEADRAQRSGEDDYNSVILLNDECQEFLAWHNADEQMDRAQQLQEAQTP